MVKHVKEKFEKLVCAVPSAEMCVEENGSHVDGYNLCLINNKI